MTSISKSLPGCATARPARDLPATDASPGPTERLLRRCLRSGPKIVDDDADALLSTLRRQLARARDYGEPAPLLDVHRAAHLLYTSLLGDPLGGAARHERSCWLNEFRSRYERALLVDEIVDIAPRLPSPQRARSSAQLTRWLLRALADVPAATGQPAPRFDPVDVRLCHHLLRSPFGGPAPAAPAPWEEGEAGRRATTDWRAYADANMVFLLGLNREHHFKAVGASLYQHCALPAGHADARADRVEQVVAAVVAAAPRAGMELAIGAALRASALARRWPAAGRHTRPLGPRARIPRPASTSDEPAADAGPRRPPDLDAG